MAEELQNMEEPEELSVEEEAEEAVEVPAGTPGNISEEELDRIADTAIAFISDLLSYMNVGEVEINEYEGDEGELILDLTGDDLAILIGRHGRTLDALQFLVSTVTSRTVGYRYPVVVDVEGNAFLHNMVRIIVGTLVEVGRGNRAVSWVGEALEACDRGAAGPTAPACGLVFEAVSYDEGVLVPWTQPIGE